MAVGPGGSIGAAGSKTVAATRIDVVDPHIAQMMRDVMSDTDTAPRLNPGGAGGGGGGGGSGESGSGSNPGEDGGQASALTNVINAAKRAKELNKEG